MNYSIKLIPSAIFFLFFCAGTNSQDEEPGIPKEQFINLYTESLTLKFSEQPFEKIDSSLVKIYQKYNLTKEKYIEVENYYKQNPKEWLEILAQVGKRIKGFSENEKVINTDKD